MTPLTRRDALGRAGFSRRDFLKTSGALVVSFSAGARRSSGRRRRRGRSTRAPSHVDPQQLDSWIAIAADGTVTAYTGKCELGQGIYTAQTQLVAEELSVPLDRVTLIQCDTAADARSGHDVGQPVDADQLQRAQPGAGRRDRARGAAARWRRRGSACRSISSTVADGVVSVEGDRVEAGHLRRARRRQEVQPAARRRTAKRKPASEWTVLGTPVPRVDMPAMATGAVRVRPQRARARACCTARVVRPPAVGATLVERRRELGRAACPAS